LKSQSTRTNNRGERRRICLPGNGWKTLIS